MNPGTEKAEAKSTTWSRVRSRNFVVRDAVAQVHEAAGCVGASGVIQRASLRILDPVRDENRRAKDDDEPEYPSQGAHYHGW